jgi:uncharacterized protein YdaU (DUF1376 family)
LSLPYFNLYPTDFEAKTSHLTLEEDGAYNRLLRLCWMMPGCSIPDDNAWIMRRMRVDQDTFERVVLVVLDEFFTRKAGRVSNARMMREFSTSSAAHEKRVLAGKRGGTAKALKSLEDTPSKAKAMPYQPEPEPEPEPDIREKEAIASTKKQPRKLKLPEGWVPNDRNIQDAIERQFSEKEIHDEASKFRDYHHAKGTTFADWNAGWRTWLGNARKFGARSQVAGRTFAARGGRGGSIASIAAERRAAGSV